MSSGCSLSNQYLVSSVMHSIAASPGPLQSTDTCRRPPFVAYDAVLTALTASTPKATIIVGEPGLGKSRVLDEARTHQVIGSCIRVSCVYIARHLSYEPIVCLGRQLCSAGLTEPQRLTRLKEASEQDRLLYGLEVLEQAADRAQLTIQFDDLHWTDNTTLAALQFYVDRLQDLPICWHIASRPRVDAVDEIVRRMVQSGLARCLCLPGFSADDIFELAHSSGHADFDRGAAIWVRDQTKGNPFFANLLLEEGSYRQRSVSNSTRRVLAAKVHSASKAGVKILHYLAVDNAPLPSPVLARLMNSSDAQVRSHLHELLEAQIVEVVDGEYGFRHALQRDAVYNALAREEATALHLELAATSSTLTQTIGHLVAAGDSQAAQPLLVRLGWDNLEKKHPTDALAAFQRVLDGSPCELQLKTEALGGLSAALYALNKPRQASDALRSFEAGAESLPVRRRICTRAKIVECAYFNIGDAAVLVTANKALREAQVDAKDLIPMISFTLGEHYLSRQRLANAKKIVENGLSYSSGSSSPDSIKLRSLLGRILGQMGDRSGIEVLKAAIEDATAVNLAEVRALACLRMFGLCQLSGDFVAAEYWSRDGLETQGPRSKDLEAQLQLALSMSLSEVGRIREALSLAHSLEKSQAPDWQEYPLLVFQQAYCYTLLGEFRSAETSLSKITSETALPTALVSYTRGFIAEGEYNYNDAFACYECVSEQSNYFVAVNAMRGAVRVAWALRDRSKGKLAIARFEKFHSLTGCGTNRHCVEALGYWQLLTGSTAEGCQNLLDAAKTNGVYRRAHLWLDVAAARHDRSLFLEAINLLDTIEAHYAADGARRTARSIGFHAGRKHQSHEGLTDREWEVAHLIAAGLTNNKIADRLQVTPRTVEYHISNILHKTKLRSRIEIAARMSAGRPLIEP